MKVNIKYLYTLYVTISVVFLGVTSRNSYGDYLQERNAQVKADNQKAKELAQQYAEALRAYNQGKGPAPIEQLDKLNAHYEASKQNLKKIRRKYASAKAAQMGASSSSSSTQNSADSGPKLDGSQTKKEVEYNKKRR